MAFMTAFIRAFRQTTKRSRYGLAAGLGLFIGLLIVSGVAVLTQPRWLFSVATRIMPGALYSVTLPEDAPPTIALTIDDGPSSATADILAVLARYDAKATFF